MTNYEKLFGTPERAAETLSLIRCGDEPCVGCPVYDGCHKPNQYPMREWLESEVRDD